jgi:WD40 repeat protein
VAVGCHHKAGAYLLEWNLDKKEINKTTQLLKEADVLGVSWSHDGEVLATSGNNRINLWGRDGAHIGAVDTGDEVGRVAWGPYGQMLAVASGNVVKLFKVVKSSEQNDLPMTILPITVLKGRAGVVKSVTWNNQTLVSATDDGTVKLWQIDEGLASNLLDKLVGLSCDWLEGYLEKNLLVSKEDSDLQALCSNTWTAAPPSLVPPTSEEASPARTPDP